MMEDPKRLLSAHGGASGLERELLESLPNMGPPEGAKARAWEALALQLATATLVGTSVSTAKAASVVTNASLSKGALGTKIIAVVIAGGLSAGGGIWALSPSHEAAPRASVPAPTPVAARAKAEAPEVRAEAAAENLEEESAVDAEISHKPRRVSALKRQDALLRESALLKEARAQLRAGDAKAAQASLGRLASEFPDGVLGQEREVLAIAVLSAEGQVERAQQRAKAFVKAHPRSPHSAALQGLLEPP
jgi:hypothetical protein